MMRILGSILIVLFCWTTDARAACSGSGQLWSCPAGSSSSDVQTALNNASDGATITFAAGSYTLSNWVKFSNTKGATLICASAGACTINFGSNAVFGSDTFGGTNTHLYRISGFTFANGGIGAQAVIWIDNYNGSNPVVMTKIRVDNNIFRNLGTGTTGVFFGHNTGVGNYYGVIDHNAFTNASIITALMYMGEVNSAPPTSQFGTANNLFFEDNTITITTLGNASVGGCTDSWGGAAYVVRHNTSLNCLWATHGVGHGGGPANYEFYNNTVQMDAGSVTAGVEDCYRCFHHQGSGEFIAFNNVFTAYSGKAGEVISMLHYRDYPISPLGLCDGTNTILPDGNRSPIGTYRGYPCWHQPGRDFAGNLKPMYGWNNYWSDTNAQVPMSIPDGYFGSPDYYPEHMQANRDWYNAVSARAQSSNSSPFNGTTGMGFGTLANRPTTCTTGSEAADAGKGGVGYFATDQGPQGTLYRCSATNTWTVHYAPYTYPHPLQSGGQSGGQIPSAPTRLRIIGP